MKKGEQINTFLLVSEFMWCFQVTHKQIAGKFSMKSFQCVEEFPYKYLKRNACGLFGKFTFSFLEG